MVMLPLFLGWASWTVVPMVDLQGVGVRSLCGEPTGASVALFVE